MTKKIICMTGAKGSGKTSALAFYVPPSEYSKFCIVDTEDSWSDVLGNLETLNIKPGAYLRAYERFSASSDMLDLIAKNKLPWVSEQQKSALISYYQWFTWKLAETLKQGEFKYLAIDTIEPIEAAMTAWAETNRKESGWSGNRAYGKLEVEAVRPLYENLLEAIARRGIEVILLASHVKRVWENDKPILNKVQPGGRLAVLSRLSSMMFWLTQNPENSDGAPAAIVLKARMGKTEIVNGEWKTQRVLPSRIPHFTWSDVAKYQEHPANLTNPAHGESLNDSDREMISEMLTDEQMRLMLLNAEIETQSQPVVVQSLPIPIAVPVVSGNGESESVALPPVPKRKTT